jgi:hypothetical protein
MNLAYALRGELITLLNKRLMIGGQLNLDMAVGIRWIMAHQFPLIPKSLINPVTELWGLYSLFLTRLLSHSVKIGHMLSIEFGYPFFLMANGDLLV